MCFVVLSSSNCRKQKWRAVGGQHQVRWGLVLCQPESRGITVQAVPKHPGEEEGSRTRMDGDGWKGRRNQVSRVEMKSGRQRVVPVWGSAGLSVGFTDSLRLRNRFSDSVDSPKEQEWWFWCLFQGGKTKLPSLPSKHAAEWSQEMLKHVQKHAPAHTSR